MKLNKINIKKYQVSIISLFLMTIFAISTASALTQSSSQNNQDVELIPIYKASPMYPFTAYADKVSGEVKLTFTVTKEGTVTNVEVLESSPADIFDKSAVKAMEQWVFKPIEKETKASQVIEFELDTVE